jgi:hypothetical protein
MIYSIEKRFLFTTKPPSPLDSILPQNSPSAWSGFTRAGHKYFRGSWQMTSEIAAVARNGAPRSDRQSSELE